ncbi:uncharacterized protein Tco_0213621 [Tanacetum coccineum]
MSPVLRAADVRGGCGGSVFRKSRNGVEAVEWIAGVREGEKSRCGMKSMFVLVSLEVSGIPPSMSRVESYRDLLKVSGYCVLAMRVRVISPSQFEMHAINKYAQAIKHIFLENGKSLLDVIEICKASALETQEVALQTVISSLPLKGSFMCTNCNSEQCAIEASSENLLICDSCVNQKQAGPSATCEEARPSSSDPEAKENSLPVTPDKKSKRGRKRKSSMPIVKSPSSAKKNKLSQNKIQEGATKKVGNMSPRSTSAPKTTTQHKSGVKLTIKNQGLHWPVFQKGGLPDGTELTYVNHGEKLLHGYKSGHGIFCYCCNTEISASLFEAHAGWASRKKPYENIYISNGVSLHEYAVSLKKSEIRKSSESSNDDVCRVCWDECADLPSIPSGKWYCRICQQSMKLLSDSTNALAAGRVTGVDLIQQIKTRCIRIAKTPANSDLVSCVLCSKEEDEMGEEDISSLLSSFNETIKGMEGKNGTTSMMNEPNTVVNRSIGNSFANMVSSDSLNRKANFRLVEASSPDKADFDVGKRIAFPVVENYVWNAWSKFGIQKSMMNANGFFFFKFSSEKGVDEVLENGPWMIRGIPIILNKWNPSVSLNKENLSKVPVWVKLHDVPLAAFTQDGLSMIASKIGTPILLDSYTTTMCLVSWGRSSYARAMIEIHAENELKENLVIAIPNLEDEGYTRETIRIEYEWKPPRCDECKIFGHSCDSCPKIIKEVPLKVDNNETDNEGFQLVGKKGRYRTVKQGGRQIGGVYLTKPKPNFQYRPKEKEKKKQAVNSEVKNTSSNPFDALAGMEEIDANDDKGVCKNVFRSWEWTSNGNLCDKGSRIILGWDPGVVDLMVLAQTNQVLHTKIVFKKDQKTICCSFIYAHNRYTLRRELWHNLKMYKHFVRGKPWAILGDFNVALNLEDYASGPSGVDIAMREFKECVMKIEVMDINSSGLRFTWNQKPKGQGGVLKKIDRVMGNMECIDVFPCSYALFQPYRTSDHSPSILKIPKVTIDKPKPFKFFNFLAHKKVFKEVVAAIWAVNVHGYHMYRVVKKMKLLKKPLRKLLKDQGNLHNRVSNLRVELDEVQKALDLDPFNATLREEEAVYLKAFNEATLDEERFLQQKAKVEWLHVGDSNSAYFHKVVKGRTSRSRIEVITDTNDVVYEGEQVPNVFVAHYNQFLGTVGETVELDIPGLFTKILNPSKAEYMIRDVTDAEVKAAMFSIGDNKSPGLDGYTSKFFKEAWECIGGDVCKAVQEFFTNGKLLKELNHTVLALLPKVKTPSKINDYRPISCCNVLYKCISKVLTNRIKEGLNDLVSDNQSAFVPGRRIADNILITQELMHNYHRDRGPPRCAFKVDIQKAYDTVDWDFLRKILIGFGFHVTMVNWIMECVTSTSFSLSIYGVLHGYFKGRRGLRQGDPMSPYLFSLVMEILTLILQLRVTIDEEGMWNQLKFIMDALDEFKNLSGLVPSIPKSKAYFCNVLTHVKLSILNVMPFLEGKLPVKYLGVPLISSRLVYKDCKILVERVQNRVGDWKNKVLSFAGRLQLVQSVLSSMHVYWASVFLLPKRITDDIEQAMRGFLWCQGEMKKGRAKVAWNVVCLPKNEGGLGVKNLESFNIALMTTDIWNIITRKDSMWVRWIYAYKLKGRNFWDVPPRAGMSWGWRKILQIRDRVRPYIWYSLGNGRSTSAWYDMWCNQSPLCHYLSTRNITRDGFLLDSCVADVVQEGYWLWPSSWMTRFPTLNQIDIPNLVQDREDQLVWKDLSGNAQHFSVHQVWDAIRPRGDEVDWAPIITPESHEHVFFECAYPNQVWCMVRNMAGMIDVGPYWDEIISWIKPMALKRTAVSVISRLLVAATAYFIWQERNLRLFKNQVRSPAQVRDIIVYNVRLKLTTCRFKKKQSAARVLEARNINQTYYGIT